SDADDASRDGLASSGRDSSGDGETYLALRNQSLRNGVVSWKSPAPSSAMTNGATSKAPLTYREQLGRLLKETEQQGWHAL
ncbi:MAG: hypothetical protein LLG00_12015, partial [Planctomycetaceae bacterium]|nr:hypothetical protein [Planctomycetaceae bacterium]